MRTDRKPVSNFKLAISLLGILAVTTTSMRPAENPMEYALVGNESFGTTSKFEIDLFSGDAEMKKAKELLWITVASEGTEHISSGRYQITGKNANNRKAFEFMGSYTKAGQESRIKSGNIDVEIDKQQIEVGYDLTLADGSKLKGQYKGNIKLPTGAKNKDQQESRSLKERLSC